MRRLAPFLAAAALAACTGSTSHPPSTAPPEADAAHRPPPTSTDLHPTPGSGLPDPTLTPGALNPAVTQATLGATICRPGYTATIRPPAAYTDALKRRQMVAYHRTGPASAYEEDHRTPLGSGGSPRDPANLWPEPRAGAPEAVAGRTSADKDALELRVERDICSGRLSLAVAQAIWRGDWWTASVP